MNVVVVDVFEEADDLSKNCKESHEIMAKF